MLATQFGVVLTKEPQLRIAWWRLKHVLNLSEEEKARLIETVAKLAKEKYGKRRT